MLIHMHSFVCGGVNKSQPVVGMSVDCGGLGRQSFQIIIQLRHLLNRRSNTLFEEDGLLVSEIRVSCPPFFLLTTAISRIKFCLSVP